MENNDKLTEMLTLSEKDYRAIRRDSYSSVKLFLDDRKKYYKKEVLQEKVDENKSQEHEDMRFGGIVDCIKFTPEEFTDRFIVSTAPEIESPQMLKFVNELFKLTQSNTNEFGVLCGDMEVMIEQAYNNVGIKQTKLDAWKERFLVKKEGYEYFLELKERENKLLITANEYKQAQNTVDYLNTHRYTRDIMNVTNSSKYTVYDQFQIITEIEGLPMKMMIDRLILNHDKMIGTPIDLKVMGNIDIFPYNYLKLRYYIQNANYTTGLKMHFPKFKINPIRFLTVDKFRYMDPLVVRSTEKNYVDAMNGFTYRDRKYTGLIEAIKDIKFHKETGIWTSSREAQINNGIIDLKLDFEE